MLEPAAQATVLGRKDKVDMASAALTAGAFWNPSAADRQLPQQKIMSSRNRVAAESLYGLAGFATT